ncbi:KamA family radical SAM protein [Kroppenstedtia eburnea]|uniref:Lysine 2,3-aminomutase n=2 Tax=Kroppenstedtia eburnea TaxID=714067 RepID=A0A1N7KLD5_9BACL|nr:radical SAM protein [Kroppenstedtia eburnea]QKI82923.1 radical SAM protein [Kroppenstedtia eburnea]SIS62326.1 lysine 2,3-aminomutase [Kroppenstedtia eburnea]
MNNVTNEKVHRTEREMVLDVIGKFRTKMSPALSRLAKQSDPVAKQFIPSPYEALDFGTEKPFEEGKNNHGIYGLERVYEDRAVLTPYFECSAYCRYCFKKSRTLAGSAKRMSDEDIDKAIRFIESDSRIRTVLITGGDPLVDPRLLEKVLDKVFPIPHIRNIRIGTRNILFSPEKVTPDLAKMIARYQQIDYDEPRKSKNISIGLSLNHVDELTPEVVRAYQRLIREGITVRGQVVLLKGINDSVSAMRELLETFLCTGIVPYYLFHCMPVVGAKHFRTSVQKGLDLLQELSPYSGTTTFQYVYVTPIGKHRIAPGHQLEYVKIDGSRYIRSTTPYKAADFLEFSDNRELPPLHGINEEGYITSHYLDGHDEEEILA